jgi:hypothetical protein
MAFHDFQTISVDYLGFIRFSKEESSTVRITEEFRICFVTFPSDATCAHTMSASVTIGMGERSRWTIHCCLCWSHAVGDCVVSDAIELGRNSK